MSDMDRKNTDNLYREADVDAASVVDDSILASIMAVDGTAADYDDNTDSLEAIANSIKDAVTEPPTAKSLQDTLHKDGSYTYDNTTDSLEAIADAVAAISVPVSTTSATTTGTLVEDSAMGTGAPNVAYPVISSDTANTFGSWVQLDASAATDIWINSVTIGFDVSSFTAGDTSFCVEVGTGTATSEVAKIRVSALLGQASDVGWIAPMVLTLAIPIKVASGTRIAARVTDDIADAHEYGIGIAFYTALETS